MAMLGLEEFLIGWQKQAVCSGTVMFCEEKETMFYLKSLYFKLLGRIERGRPKQTWKKQVEKEMHKKWTGNEGCVQSG